LEDAKLRCRVLGNVAARGICGSGLVDAVAAAVQGGWIKSKGRCAHGTSLGLSPAVTISQRDVRELQLAKAAIAAGVRMLLHTWGGRPQDLQRLHLAGAFGNYIDRASARRIGLLNFPLDRIEPAGNTALRGAKIALFGLGDGDGSYAELRAKIEHVSLHADPEFQEIFLEEMAFPD
jgi:uncharacterized 2Fe-2S/4Fe-4S cluster protein (DUF4445 family)